MTQPTQLPEALALLREAWLLLPESRDRAGLLDRISAFLSCAQERPADESEREPSIDEVLQLRGQLNLTRRLLTESRQSAPCPHLRSSDEGTQYCALAQSGAQDAQRPDAEDQITRDKRDARRYRWLREIGPIFPTGGGQIFEQVLDKVIDAALQQSAERGEK